MRYRTRTATVWAARARVLRDVVKRPPYATAKHVDRVIAAAKVLGARPASSGGRAPRPSRRLLVLVVEGDPTSARWAQVLLFPLPAGRHQVGQDAERPGRHHSAEPLG